MFSVQVMLFDSNFIITNGRSSLTQGRITAADGWFICIHHMAPVCPPMTAHGHHLVKTIELVYIGATWWIHFNLCFLWPTWIHNPNGKLIGSAVFAQITAECPYTLQCDAPFPPKIAPSHRGSGPHLIRFPGFTPSSQPKWHLDRFSHFCRTD